MLLRDLKTFYIHIYIYISIFQANRKNDILRKGVYRIKTWENENQKPLFTLDELHKQMVLDKRLRFIYISCQIDDATKHKAGLMPRQVKF